MKRCLRPYWRDPGTIISESNRLYNEYMCFGCGGGQVCRTKVPVHSPAPKGCLDTNKLKKLEELRDNVEDMFTQKK